VFRWEFQTCAQRTFLPKGWQHEMWRILVLRVDFFLRKFLCHPAWWITVAVTRRVGQYERVAKWAWKCLNSIFRGVWFRSFVSTCSAAIKSLQFTFLNHSTVSFCLMVCRGGMFSYSSVPSTFICFCSPFIVSIAYPIRRNSFLITFKLLLLASAVFHRAVITDCWTSLS
jgi:hypothetical protein